MCFGEGKELKKFGKFLLVLNLFFLLACASQKDLDSLRLALYTQQQENQQLKQEVVNLQTKLQEITATLQQKIEQSATPVRSAQANLWAEIESLRKSLASLSGEIDEIKYSLDKDKESKPPGANPRTAKQSGQTRRPGSCFGKQSGLKSRKTHLFLLKSPNSSPTQDLFSRRALSTGP